MNINNGQPEIASNNILRQWCTNGSIQLNGKRIEFPITELIFFPRSEKRKTTLF